MATPYIGEIRQWAGPFAPDGWALCHGSPQTIAQNETLFSLLGTTYGGNGTTHFHLPDLQGRVPIGRGSGYVLGQPGGTEQETLTADHLPAHTHVPYCSSTGGSDLPAGNFWATASNALPYSTAPGNLHMNAGSIEIAGGGQPHSNLIPYQVITYIIALQGVYPEQS